MSNPHTMTQSSRTFGRVPSFFSASLILFLAVNPLLEGGAQELRYRVALVSAGKSASDNVEELAARRTLEAMGIPYDRVPPGRLDERYPLGILAGPLYNNSFKPPEREALHAFVSGGGVLLATQVEGSDYFPLFGIDRAEPRRDRFLIRFAPGIEDGWLRYLDHPKEREISLGDTELFSETIWTVGYRSKLGRPLAVYPDGTTAALVNDYDSGQAVALGVSLTQIVLLAQVGKTYEAGRQWVNSFEPSGDAFLLLLKGLYESLASPAIYWHTVPGGRDTAIVLSHDVDARESFQNSVEYARVEKQYGVKATFFITTKTITDSADVGYYDASRIPLVNQTRRMGGEIGSHSVSHSKNFARFQMGNSSVTAATYRPDRLPSILGEVQVSKELLDRDLPGQQTLSFRAGELAFPDRLIEALEIAGYRYDSTFSANDIITNFPFLAFAQRALGARATRIVEIPVTLDDSQGFLTAASKEKALQTWIEIIESNRANAAATCVLIHPTDTTYKLEVLERLLKRYTRENVWIGSVSELGEFWSRRLSVAIDLEMIQGNYTVRLNRDLASLGEGLTLVVSGHSKAATFQVLDREKKPVSYRQVQQGGKQHLILRSGG